MPKSLKVVVGALVAAFVVVVGLVAFLFLRDSAEDPASLQAITPGSVAGDPSARSSADGTWKVQPGDDVFVGYRVHEKLRGLDKEVTGRTPAVTGTMAVDGSSVTSASFTADLTQLASDDPMRDRAIGSRGPETGRFPEATLTLPSPLTLPAVPEVGKSISVTAPVRLTIHGVTKEVEIPLQAQWDGGTIRVATTGEGVRFQFQDYGFEAITVPVATTDDFGFLEVQLLLVPA